MSDHTQSVNPFEAPRADSLVLGKPDANAQPMAVRREYLGREVAIRSTALMYVAGAIFACVTASVLLPGLLGDHGQSSSMARWASATAVLALLHAWLAFGIHRLQPAARLVASLYWLAVAFYAVPLGTLVAAVMLYLYWSKRGRLVFSSQYRAVIAETPQIRYARFRMSAAAWCLVAAGLIMAMAVLALR